MGHISVINDETMAKTHSLTFIVSNKRQITTELKCLSRVTNNIEKENVKHRKTRKKANSQQTKHTFLSLFGKTGQETDNHCFQSLQKTSMPSEKFRSLKFPV